MSLAESIIAKMACHTPSKVVGHVDVGMQCSLPLADKSVGCSLKPGRESRSVQTTEAVEQLSSSSASRPCISPSTAKRDNSRQGCLHRCHLCDFEADELFLLEAHASVHTAKKQFECPSCSRRYSDKYKFKFHLRSHTGKNPHQCPSCSSSFSHKYYLIEHLRSHTDPS
ncbi:uncharacterized protein LOC142589959 isoform X4 [Dermacentor variabilis]|uniref:uncharacterized protein LOC142589959 isoform X4 n=1 Tax=Dermacentor variabilis TaxID=34621 RepID=UPI003F5B488B